MQNEPVYGLAAFRSRQSVYKYESALRRAQVASSIVSTPAQIAIGCGLSVRFPAEDLSAAIEVYQQSPMDNLIGIYLVRGWGSRPTLQPVYGGNLRFV